MVPEDGRPLRKQRTLVGFLYVVLKGHESIFAGLVEQVVHHLERIEVSLFSVLRAAEDAADSAGDLLKNVKRIGDEDGADSGPPDSNQFGGLKEDADISVLHEIAGGDAAEHHDNADNGEHDLTRLAQFPDRELTDPAATARPGSATRFPPGPGCARSRINSAVSPIRAPVQPIKTVTDSSSPHH